MSRYYFLFYGSGLRIPIEGENRQLQYFYVNRWYSFKQTNNRADIEQEAIARLRSEEKCQALQKTSLENGSSGIEVTVEEMQEVSPWTKCWAKPQGYIFSSDDDGDDEEDGESIDG